MICEKLCHDGLGLRDTEFVTQLFVFGSELGFTPHLIDVASAWATGTTRLDRVDNALRVHVSIANPTLRQSNNRWELLVPVVSTGGPVEVLQKIVW